jgi:glycine/D-amino acid oxidase-like deaminating enzyme
VHPARLARGLAREVERLGGTIHERTAVRSLDDRAVRTEHGTVRADVVVRGTGAYTRSLEGQEREMLPFGNYMVATEPIDAATWAGIGLADRQLFELSAVMLGYGQRTADGRIAWGGLAGTSKWASRVPASPMHNARVAARLRRVLVRLFPTLDGIGFSHHWGGVLGVPRDLLPGIGYDRETGFAWAGGYTGQGVAAANAAGSGGRHRRGGRRPGRPAHRSSLIRGARTARTRPPSVLERRCRGAGSGPTAPGRRCDPGSREAG